MEVSTKLEESYLKKISHGWLIVKIMIHKNQLINITYACYFSLFTVHVSPLMLMLNGYAQWTRRYLHTRREHKKTRDTMHVYALHDIV